MIAIFYLTCNACTWRAFPTIFHLIGSFSMGIDNGSGMVRGSDCTRESASKCVAKAAASPGRQQPWSTEQGEPHRYDAEKSSVAANGIRSLIRWTSFRHSALGGPTRKIALRARS